jgi:hypothetical protein
MEQAEWLRIALAMALMIGGFIVLPAFFLWKDKRQDEREAAAERDFQDFENPESPQPTHTSHESHSEAGATR